MEGFYNIYKNDRYSQNRIDDYVLWVKKIGLQVYKGNTPIYAVSKKIEIDTPDGPMLSVKVCDDVANPNLEPIAEVVINNIVYYILDDYLYAVGTRTKVSSLPISGVSPRDSLVRQFHFSNDIPPWIQGPGGGSAGNEAYSITSPEPIHIAINRYHNFGKAKIKYENEQPSWTLKMVIYKIGEDPIF